MRGGLAGSRSIATAKFDDDDDDVRSFGDLDRDLSFLLGGDRDFGLSLFAIGRRCSSRSSRSFAVSFDIVRPIDNFPA